MFWPGRKKQKHAALETAIANAYAATPPEGSTLFAALNEAKEAARRGRGGERERDGVRRVCAGLRAQLEPHRKGDVARVLGANRRRGGR